MPVYETKGYARLSSVELTVDVNTTLTSFTSLFSIPVSLSSNSELICEFASSSLNATAQNLFRLTVDGTIYQSSAIRMGAGSTIICPTVLLDRITGLSAGDHTVEIQWAVTGDTGYIRPVSRIGYEYASLVVTEAEPLYVVPNAVCLQQTSKTSLTADTTVGTGFTDLLSANVTTTGGSLIVLFEASASNTNTSTALYFQIVVDSTVYASGAVRYVGSPACSLTLMDKISGLSSGSHVVKIQWRAGSNTGRIRPVVAAGSENAVMTVMEVSG